MTTFSQNYTSCCNSRPPLQYILSWVKCGGLCITFSQCQSPGWGLGQTLSNGCQFEILKSIAFSRFCDFFILHFVRKEKHFQLLLCVRGSKKKVLMVKLFDGFSNQIVNKWSVNRKFGYMLHLYCWCLLLLFSVVVVYICCYLLWKGLTFGSIFHMLWWFNQKSVIDATWEPSLVDEVKGHLRSSCKIGQKSENGLIWKVEVGFEPNLVYWYNVWTLICSCSQRSCSKVKGLLKSSCNRCGWSRSDVNLHHPQTATAGDRSGDFQSIFSNERHFEIWFPKWKQLHFSEENYLNYTKKKQFCKWQLHKASTRANKNKQWTHLGTLLRWYICSALLSKPWRAGHPLRCSHVF